MQTTERIALKSRAEEKHGDESEIVQDTVDLRRPEQAGKVCCSFGLPHVNAPQRLRSQSYSIKVLCCERMKNSVFSSFYCRRGRYAFSFLSMLCCKQPNALFLSLAKDRTDQLLHSNVHQGLFLGPFLFILSNRMSTFSSYRAHHRVCTGNTFPQKLLEFYFLKSGIKG